MNINNPSTNLQQHSHQEGQQNNTPDQSLRSTQNNSQQLSNMLNSSDSQQNNTPMQSGRGTSDSLERMTEMTDPTPEEAPGRAEVNTNDEDIAQAQEQSR